MSSQLDKNKIKKNDNSKYIVKNKPIEEMRDLRVTSHELSHLRMTYCDIQEDRRWGTYKELLKDIQKN